MSNKMRECAKNYIYIVFSMYIVTILLQDTSLYRTEGIFENIVKIIRYTCYFFFGVKILANLIKKTKISIVMICLMTLSIIIYFVSKNKKLLILMLLLLSLSNTDSNKLLNIGFKTYFITYLLIIVGALLNLIPDWTYAHLNGNQRHSLGFYYPTIAVARYLMIVLMYVYIRKDKINFLEIILLQIMNVFLYNYTIGRTSYILVTCVLLLVLVKKIRFVRLIAKSKTFSVLTKICCYILPTVLLLSILVMTHLYGINNNIAYKLNDILSNRIKYSYKAFQEYELTLFGQNIKWYGWGGVGYDESIDLEDYTYNFVDNSYVRLIFDCGIVTTAVVIIGYTMLLVKNYKEKNYWKILIIFIILCMAELEPCLVDFNSNIFLIWFLPLLEEGTLKFGGQNNKISNKLEEKNN